MISPLERWYAQIRQERDRQEAQWAALTAAVEQLVRQHAAGQHAEAADSAKVALDLEYDLLGDCEFTGALCASLMLPTALGGNGVT